MDQKRQDEIMERIRILHSMGMNDLLCERIEDGEFVLQGYTLKPRPEYEECKRLKEEFEREYGGTVLLGILSIAGDAVVQMQLLSFLFISSNEDEWESERADLQEGYQIAMVYNLTDGISEMGGIEFEFNENGYPVITA